MWKVEHILNALYKVSSMLSPGASFTLAKHSKYAERRCCCCALLDFVRWETVTVVKRRNDLTTRSITLME